MCWSESAPTSALRQEYDVLLDDSRAKCQAGLLRLAIFAAMACDVIEERKAIQSMLIQNPEPSIHEQER